jgi:hypothetical protein
VTSLLRTLARVLGIELLVRLGARLPEPWPRVVSVAIVLGTNLLPVLAVAGGRTGVGDVFLAYWLENVVVWLACTLRVATARGGLDDGSGVVMLSVNGGAARPAPRWMLPSFFAFHYGLFTLAQGVFTIVVVVRTGLVGGVLPALGLAAVLALGQVAALAIGWFGRGERELVSAGRAMLAPYRRLVALLLGTIGGFYLVVGFPDSGPVLTDAQGATGAVLLVCVLKTLVECGVDLLGWTRGGTGAQSRSSGIRTASS